MATYGSYKKITTDAVVDGTVTAGNLSSGTLSALTLAANTVGTNQLAASVDLSSKTVTYRSLTNSDFSASAALASSRISGVAASATTDTTNASNITSGLINEARIASVASSALSGALPAIDGSALTGMGEICEMFYTSFTPGNISDGGRLQNMTFTTTFKGIWLIGWNWAYRPTGSFGQAFHYIYPEIADSAGNTLTVLHTYGGGANNGSMGWTKGTGSTLYDNGGPRNAGTYNFRLRMNTGGNQANTGDDTPAHYVIWNLKRP